MSEPQAIQNCAWCGAEIDYTTPHVPGFPRTVRLCSLCYARRVNTKNAQKEARAEIRRKLKRHR